MMSNDMPDKKVVIFGTGDLAQLACIYLQKDSPYDVAAFTVHQDYLINDSLLDLEVVPYERIEESHPPSDYAMFVAVGYKRVNKEREEIYNHCKSKGYELITYINSRATQWGEFEIGENCFVFEENVIQPFVSIGNNVIIWSGNHIGHHSRIGDHCFIASHAVISGHVEIGSHCFVGVNATFRDGVKVSRGCVIGAGATVMQDTQVEEVLAVKGTVPSRVKSHQLMGFK